jgi:dTDP-4-dehydrorhamnose reductase
MKIGIVGGNSRVGTELSVLLDGAGHDVVPVVRNRLSGALFERAGFEVRVADMTDAGDARETLAGLDVVVIAAHADVESTSAKRAKQINERLVANSVSYSPADATPVFFSSIAAYGDAIYSEIQTPAIKVRQKRRGERILQERCDETGKAGYALRLGHVLGPLQLWTAELEAAIQGRDVLSVPANADTEANVLHTVTLADAIDRCGREVVEPGVHNCVDEPQWTWRQVIEYYAPASTEVDFEGPSRGADRTKMNLVGTATTALEPLHGKLLPLFEYLPETAFHYLKNNYLRKTTASEITSIRARRTLDLKICHLDPIPGPNLPGLPETRHRLEENHPIEDVSAPVDYPDVVMKS